VIKVKKLVNELKKLVNKVKKLGNKGSAIAILCIAITGLLGFTALVTDIGMVYKERTNLSNAIDSAVLAASVDLMQSEAKAKMTAEEYLRKNNVDPNNVTIHFGSDGKSIEIKGTKNVKHFFAPVIGIKDSDVGASAKAIIGPVGAVRGEVRPFAVEMFDYTYGDRVTLKTGAGDGYKGNYLAVALGGTGANAFRDNALYGFSGTIKIGDWIQTETGNMAGATNEIKNYINAESSSFDNFEKGSNRLWTIPLVDTLNLNGRSEIQVVAFGQFYVEEVQGQQGKIEITGRFIQYVTNGTVDMTLQDTGTYGVKLSN
jgi:hypothetical protein